MWRNIILSTIAAAAWAIASPAQAGEYNLSIGETLSAVWMAGPSEVYTAGNNAQLHVWNGSLWTPIDTGHTGNDGSDSSRL